MFKNQLVIAVLYCTIITIGCQNANKETLDSLNKEVIAVHNEVMPKMGEINRLKRQMRSYKDAISDEKIALKDSVINTILLLSKSEDLMNDWMANYDYPNTAIADDKMIQYLKGQKDTIQSIGNNIYMSIAIANGLLTNAPDSIKTNTVIDGSPHNPQNH
jgi:hypothetical protein